MYLQQMSIEKEVQSLINTLGFLEKGVYYPEPDCFQNARDLVRHLRRDDRLHTVRRLCNGHNIVKNDLVPIMRMDSASDELFDVALRLTVNLCQPTLALFEGKPPEESADWQIFYELESALIRTIVAFSDPKIFHIFCAKIRHYFDQEWEDRTEKERILVERIFVLIRYIFGIGVESIKHLSVPEVDDCCRTRVVANFFASGVEEIFLKLAGNSMEKEFCGYVVLILALIFKNTDPKTVAHEGQPDLESKDREKLEAERAQQVEAMRAEEADQRRKVARRSFLAGTLVAKGVKALNPDKEFIVRSSLAFDNSSSTNRKSGAGGIGDASCTAIAALGRRKKQRLPPRNRRVLDLEATAASTSSSTTMAGGDQEMMLTLTAQLEPTTLAAIKQFWTRLLLEGKYNRLMRTTRDMAFGSRRPQQQQQLRLTELHFLALAAFGLAFARHSRLSHQHVVATFSVEFFHQITAFLTDCFDKMKADRQHIRRYALSAQYAVTTFREMVIMLNSMSGSMHAEEREYGQRFCHQIFQVEEYRELAAGILLHLSPAGTSQQMLRDLILANHFFLFLMEKSVRDGELRKIQRKKAQRKRKAVQSQRYKSEAKSIENIVKLKGGLDLFWQDLESELVDTLNGTLSPNEDASPLNMLIKADDEQLQQFAQLQVQLALRTRRVADAVGAYRNARVLWPETGTFGLERATAEEEKAALEQLFRADMRPVSKLYTAALQQAYGRSGGTFEVEEAEEEQEKTEKKTEENQRKKTVEEEEKEVDEGREEEDENDENDENRGEEKEEETPMEMEEDGEEDEKANIASGLFDELKDADAPGQKENKEEDFELVESDFDLHGFISSMAKPAVVNWYIFSLRQFRTNPREVNLAIVKFFHRIAFDLKSPARLYLASLFKVFQEIGAEVSKVSSAHRDRSQHPHFKLYEFGYFLLGKFFAHFEHRGPGIMACELLFAKTAREAYEIEHGYGSMD